MQINEHILKFTGSASMLIGLDIDTEYEFKVLGECKEKKLTSNDNGTFDITYPVRLITGEMITKTGEVIKLKDRKSRSQKLRNRIWLDWKEKGEVGDFDDFYDKKMVEIILNYA